MRKQMTDLKSTTALTQPNRPLPFKRPPPKLYTGPAVPAAYDAAWRTYTNLTPAQIDAFKAMPETCQQVARDLRHAAVLGAVPKITPDMTLPQVQAAFDTAKAAVAAPFATEGTVLGNIGTAVHNQADVEKAFGANK
jgi:hypothetical protein